jgi:hypothetical protein
VRPPTRTVSLVTVTHNQGASESGGRGGGAAVRRCRGVRSRDAGVTVGAAAAGGPPPGRSHWQCGAARH